MNLNQYEWDPDKDLIAAGAFAEVFKARDRNNENRFVALKIYKEGITQGTSKRQVEQKYTLEQEFRKVDGLSHTNIISYYGLDYLQYKDALGRTAGYPVLIMEYASCGTLLQFMESKPSNELIEKIICDIIDGVAYLHSEGTIHRDLKPGNILITRNRRGEPVAKITDFGISKDSLAEKSDQTLTEEVGTPHYMAPEQFYRKKFGLNGELSERTDIWAIGIIVYRILTGRRPFGHETSDYEIIRDAIIKDPPDLSPVPLKYQALINSCLEKQASLRAANAQLLKEKIAEPVPEEEATVIKSMPEEDATVFAPASTLKPPPGPRPARRKIPAIIAIAVLAIASGFFFTSGKDKAAELAVVKVNQKYGYIDREGNKIIPFKYDAAWKMSEGMALVGSNGKWGYINNEGELVIDMIYDAAHPFSEGLAAVQRDEKWGYINKDGEYVIAGTYDNARSYSEGLAPVEINNKWGFINKQEEVIIPAKYDGAYAFSEGLAVVNVNGREGYINNTGNLVIAPEYDLALEFSEDLAAVNLEGKWGFINKTGSMVIPPTYSGTWGFSEGLAAVEIEGKWGFINKKGEVTIAPKYEDASGFSNGLSGVRLNGKEGFIDKDEKVVIPFSYDYTDMFCDLSDVK